MSQRVARPQGTAESSDAFVKPPLLRGAGRVRSEVKESGLDEHRVYWKNHRSSGSLEPVSFRKLAPGRNNRPELFQIPDKMKLVCII